MESTIDLDDVLGELGQFGKFQKRNYFLICLVIIFSVLPMGYIFTTRHSKYRCFVDGCDTPTSNYQEDWLKSAIPFKDDVPQSCSMYASSNSSKSSNMCDPNEFDISTEKDCDVFIFENGNATIERDFKVLCEYNLWKLTIVGTINNIGELACLPLSGYVSDRYGRRTMMIVSVLLSTACGIMKSLSPTYVFYVIMEFLDTSLGSGTYSAAYILAIELVTPEQRVLGNTLIACAFAIGEAILGIVAWVSNSWRVMLQVLYAPGILFLLYYKFSHESVRWLLSKGEHEKSKTLLQKVAKTNNTVLPDKIIQKLALQKEATSEINETWQDVLKSRVLLTRLINCCFGWMSCTFVFYGLTMHSVSISGNLYVNFIMVALIEMPAYLVSYCTLDKIGRKMSLSLSLMLSAAACITFVFVPAEYHIIQLILFMVGKFAVTIAYTTMYIYTTEMFPTNMRHSLLSICSMCGRFGSMIAPQIPLLARISRLLPLILFSAMAATASMLTLFFPETLNTKLPDTIDEAVHIGVQYIDHNCD